MNIHVDDLLKVILALYSLGLFYFWFFILPELAALGERFRDPDPLSSPVPPPPEVPRPPPLLAHLRPQLPPVVAAQELRPRTAAFTRSRELRRGAYRGPTVCRVCGQPFDGDPHLECNAL